VVPFLPTEREQQSLSIRREQERPREREGLPKAAAMLPCTTMCESNESRV